MNLEDYCKFFGTLARSKSSDFTVGENISPIPQLKIIFDGYGYDEETDTEGGDLNTEKYCLFVHKNSTSLRFTFPDHDLAYGLISHRPDVEVCIDMVFEVNEARWYINFSDGNCLDEIRLVEILSALHKPFRK